MQIPSGDGSKKLSPEEFRENMEAELKALPPRPLHRTIFKQAEMFNRAAVHARSQIEATGDADYAFTYLVNRGFAAELLLKFFIAARHPGKSYSELKGMGLDMYGHPCSKLFDRISPEHQAAIAAEYSRRSGSAVGPAEFREVLVSMGDQPFVNWRYPFESDEIRHVDLNVFDRAIDTMGMVGLDVCNALRAAEK